MHRLFSVSYGFGCMCCTERWGDTVDGSESAAMVNVYGAYLKGLVQRPGRGMSASPPTSAKRHVRCHLGYVCQAATCEGLMFRRLQDGVGLAPIIRSAVGQCFSLESARHHIRWRPAHGVVEGSEQDVMGRSGQRDVGSPHALP